MQRRSFLAIAGTGGYTAARKWSRAAKLEHTPARRPKFPDEDAKWGRTWDAALVTLAGNVKLLSPYSRPVLIEGAEYPGIWQECAPLEGLVYGMDNSPRWAGMPNRCLDRDARKCPPVKSLPRLCPDLSATVYGDAFR
jgi:hypothetical protein